MVVKRKATSQLQRAKGLDFRCPNDEAWYSVRLLKDEDSLRVMYLQFPEDSDESYLRDKFQSLQEIDELIGRFRLPAEQLQDSQCREVTQGKLVLACHTFSTGELMFYDAMVDSVSRSKHIWNGASEEEVCTCKFHVRWKQGPEKGNDATVRSGDICLIQDSPLQDPVLKDFIESARRSLEERMGNLANQGGNSGFNTASYSHRASPHPANVPDSIDMKFSDSLHHHHQEIEKSYEATKPQNKSGGDGSTVLGSKGMRTNERRCFFFLVDNMDENVNPPRVIKFLERELCVPCQVVLFPNLFLADTYSGAIYVESMEHANRVLKLLTNPDSIIVSSNGRPWVNNERCCGIFDGTMPWQERTAPMVSPRKGGVFWTVDHSLTPRSDVSGGDTFLQRNQDTENQEDASEIRVLHPGSEGYEEASKMRDLYKEHCDRLEGLQQTLRYKEMELRYSLANGPRSKPLSSK